MALRLNGQTSGYVELDAPAVAGSNTLTLPNGNGSSGQVLSTDGSGGLSWQTVTDTGAQWTSGTTQTLSGTSQLFDNIPSNAAYIEITFVAVSFNAAVNLAVQLGDSAGLETSGYVSRSNATSSVAGNITSGFEFNFIGAASYSYSGYLKFRKHSGNTWVVEGMLALETANDIMSFIGYKTLSDTLTQIQLYGTPSGGSFDAGTATIHYLTSS